MYSNKYENWNVSIYYSGRIKKKPHVLFEYLRILHHKFIRSSVVTFIQTNKLCAK